MKWLRQIYKKMKITKNDKIFVAGHNGLVGSAIVRELKRQKFTKIILRDKKKLNLLDQNNVYSFLKKKKPKFVFIAAAKVGGILTNNNLRAQFIYENLAIQNNLIHGSYQAGIKDLIFLGSNCVYPKNCPQPIKEKYLLNNYLEYTNEPYAIAKIAGIKMCENYNLQYKTNYKCLMPANLYGPNDNYNSQTSHFLPAIIRKTVNLKTNKRLIMWGNGITKREVLFVDDLAEACIYFMNKKTNNSVINIGSGKDFTINYYVSKVLDILNIKTKIYYDKTKPTGTPRKLLDCSLAKKYGWHPKTTLRVGLEKTIKAFKNKNIHF
jgi:GDP-L-fucose synthase